MNRDEAERPGVGHVHPWHLVHAVLERGEDVLVQEEAGEQRDHARERDQQVHDLGLRPEPRQEGMPVLAHAAHERAA